MGGQVHGDKGVNDEQHLVARAVANDPDAWEALYRGAYPGLFAYARRRLSSDDAADDAVSETMIRALDRIGSFTWQGAGFDAWLTGILRNVVLETYRRDRRPVPVAAFVAGDPAEPLDRVVAEEEQVAVRAAFDRLAPHEQEVLELRLVQGLSAEGVGEVLGRRAGAVRMAQARAVGRLRTFYEERTGAV
jgi:RNA polymerase sigma-70 factor (ECF subfamily)